MLARKESLHGFLLALLMSDLPGTVASTTPAAS